MVFRGYPNNKFWVRISTLVLLIFLSACENIVIVDGVEQREATSIVATLIKNGIPARAESISSKRGKYQITVKEEHYSSAITVLAEHKLPGEVKLTFAQLIEQSGFMPISREMERLKIQHALAAEIEELLESYPGVDGAEVLVRGLDKPLAPKPDVNEISVGAVIVVNQQELLSHTTQFEEIIKRAIPGINAENLTIVARLRSVDDLGDNVEGVQNMSGKVRRVPLVPFLLTWRIAEDDYNGLALTLVAVLATVGAAGGVIGYLLAISSHRTVTVPANKRNLGVKLEQGNLTSLQVRLADDQENLKE